MEIEYKGANCVVIKDKKILIVVDPTTNVSVKDIQNPDTMILATQEKIAPKNVPAFVIDMPGEYEHENVSIRGIAAHAHIDKDGKNATIYRVEIESVRIAIIGHVDAPLSDDDLEDIGVIDIVIIPVGGGGYTLDARDAATITRQIAPKIVIPTHYADTHIKYEVPQEDVAAFTKEIGGAHEKSSALRIKNVSSLPEILTIYELTRTA